MKQIARSWLWCALASVCGLARVAPASAGPVVGHVDLDGLMPFGRVGALGEFGAEGLPLRIGGGITPFWRGGQMVSGYAGLNYQPIPSVTGGLKVGSTVSTAYVPGLDTYLPAPMMVRPVGRWVVGVSLEYTPGAWWFRLAPNISIVPPDSQASRPLALGDIVDSVGGIGDPWLEVGYHLLPFLRLSVGTTIATPLKVTLVL